MARISPVRGSRATTAPGRWPKRLFSNLLQIVIDGQRDLLAGNRFLGGEAANFFANAVDDHAAHAVGADQLVVVLAFEAGFSGQVARTEFAIAGFDLRSLTSPT